MTWSARQWLGVPWIFSLFNTCIGAAHARRVLVERYMQIPAGARVLDVGCGTADVLAFLPPVIYTGFDPSPSYIAQAQERYKDAGTFLIMNVEQALSAPLETYDVVLAIGLLHHLTDAEAAQLFMLVRRVLTPQGRLITFDGCYIQGQSIFAQRFLAADRGAYVRTDSQYKALASPHFSTLHMHVHHDLLRIPYTHMIMRCENPIPIT